MAAELVSFGVQKLWDLLSQEYQQFQGVEDQVTELKGDLNMLTSFLKDADARKQTSAVVRNCVEEIKGIICDAEDIIETFLLKEKFRKTSGIKKRIKRLACVIPDHREIALDIEGISKRISKVIQVMQSFGVHQIIADGSYMQPLHDRQRAARQTFSKDYESDLVGLEANVKKLVGYLVKEDNVQVVSITGMGGVGKTTLARQVFNHEDVKQQFDGLAWVCVSQDFTRKNVWQKILGNFKPKEEEKKILEMTESTFQGELFGLLETCCKVLLTSRNESVAMRRDTTYINFKPDFLNDEDRWTLFQRIAHPRKDASEFKVDEEMEEIGKQMIKHTGGLPLAIKVLGGFLATKYTLKDWKRISENAGSHMVEGTHSNEDNNSSVYHVLSMSFEELPSHLKYCFLYLAHFPEDYLISVENLSYYWAAEGIPKPRHYDGETIRDVGDSYIEELPKKRTFYKFTSSRPSTANFQSPVTSRRLVYQYPTTLHVERDINNPKLRSLVVVLVNDFWGTSWELSGSSYTRLQLLRMLDLSQAKFRKGKLPYGIGKLIHLRYLSLKDAKVSQLPSSLGNLVFLIYLNLEISTKMGNIFMPNVLMGMQELRYLALPHNMRRKTKLELRSLVNLETLKNFSTKESSSKDLHGIAKLRTLRIIATSMVSIETLSAAIGGLKHLENLRIRYYNRFRRANEKGIILDFVHLKKLKLDMYMTRLPKEEHFPSHLTILHLYRCHLEEDPMRVLEKLLELKEVSLRYQSFCGRRMVCSGNGFPQLQMLLISELESWEEWIVEEGFMPLLHTLSIDWCPKLKELPDELRFLYSLKDLTMPMKWKERLSEGGDEYNKVKHIPSLVYVRDHDE